jgi:hypothetical protein
MGLVGTWIRKTSRISQIDKLSNIFKTQTVGIDGF